ncbi:tyrosine-protein phosphatase [Bacillaceae bacterium W0354]
MSYCVDIHNHLIWGIDDGPDTAEQSFHLAYQAVKQGITHVISTAHFKHGIIEPKLSIINERLNELKLLLSKHNIPLSIHSGMEIQLYSDLDKDLIKGDSILTLNNTKYVLIEFPPHHIPHYSEQILFNLQLNGYVPIIAHAERNSQFQKDLNKLQSLVERGSLIQISANSLIQKRAKKTYRFTNKLIQKRLVHLVASDAHNNKTRPFLLEQAYSTIEKKYGDSLNHYFMKNAKNILLDNDIYIPQPVITK